MKKLETRFEHLLFISRWLMAPVYLGLVLAMLVLLYKFGKEVLNLFFGVTTATDSDLIIGVLSLVDVALIMNLLIIIVFSGYENFVSRMADLHDHEDRPDWMGHIGFSDLKVKLVGSMVAISGIELLKAFMKLSQGGIMLTEAELAGHQFHLTWMVIIHATFLISGLAYVLMDRFGNGKHKNTDAT
ncbi:MAG: TIGR00645 family protein [Azoarcus sp.]|nr:TIGR00645 family protein [Azoarcus sp.]